MNILVNAIAKLRKSISYIYPNVALSFFLLCQTLLIAFLGTLVRHLLTEVTPNQDLLLGIYLAQDLGLLQLGIEKDLPLEVMTGLSFLMLNFKFLWYVLFFCLISLAILIAKLTAGMWQGILEILFM